MKKRTYKKDHKPNPSVFEKKLFIISLVFGFIFLTITYRLFSLHVLQSDMLVSKSESQYFRTMTVQPYRGTIFDRNGNILAINLKCKSLFAVPHEIEDPEGVAMRLARVLKMSEKEEKTIFNRLKSNKKFKWIKRKLTPELAEEVALLNIKGLHFTEETKRFYPKKELAASVIGFVGIDNQGLYGLENRLDKVIRGEKKRIRLMTDAKGRSIEVHPAQSYTLPGYERGADVTLTIEPSIQYRAEKSLEEMVLSTNAKSGMAIVMEAGTGEILSMAEYPRFNPNKINYKKRNYWISKAAGFAFEPGSIMKPLTVAIALNEGKVNPDSVIYCENGRYRINRMSIGEAMGHRYENLTVKEVLAQSSNIGTIKIANRVSDELFYNYLKDFGVNNYFDIELSGENKGLLATFDNWRDSTKIAVSFGQEVSVNLVQMAAAYGVIANGGYLVRPTLIKEIIQNETVQRGGKEVIRQVIRPEVAKTMRDMLQNVVTDGTGKSASIKGYSVAGKTGSAEKFDKESKRYFKEKEKMIASFAGFLPANNPKVVIIVAVDEPQKGYWGGKVAAPVFKDIAKQVINYYGIPSENTEEQLIL